jgi:hypothetical protein
MVILIKAVVSGGEAKMESKACPIRIGTAAARAALEIAPPNKVILNGQ